MRSFFSIVYVDISLAQRVVLSIPIVESLMVCASALGMRSELRDSMLSPFIIQVAVSYCPSVVFMRYILPSASVYHETLALRGFFTVIVLYFTFETPLCVARTFTEYVQEFLYV
jgi:hypothetical protein